MSRDNSRRWFDTRVPRRLVLAVVLVAALAVTAGCVGILSEDEGGASGAQMEKVPDSAEMVMHVDAGMLNDQDVRDLVAQTDPEGADNMEEGLTKFENQTGLDPAEMDGATLFMTSTPDVGGGEMGMLLDSSWDVETVVEAVEQDEDVTLERTEYQGESVLWVPETEPEFGSPTYVAEHDDGQIMIGDRASVEASLDVTYGDAAALSGPMLDAFENAPDGHVRFAMTTEGEAFQQGLGMGGFAGTGGMGGSSAFMEDMTAVAGTFYTDDGTAGVEAHVHFSNADTAENAKGAASLALDEATANAPPEQQQLFEKLSVSADGDTVVVTWESDIDALSELESAV